MKLLLLVKNFPTRLASLVYLFILIMALSGCQDQPGVAAVREVVSSEAQMSAIYTGSGDCAECHEIEAANWQNSHHKRAMQNATADTVLGDFADAKYAYAGVTSRFSSTTEGFVVRTDGADGELADFRVRYTFGIAPLQQYLLEHPSGRLQTLSVSWDARAVEEGGQRWFHLYPDEQVAHTDVLHWTQPSANWNFMCADCHSTGLTKGYDAQTRSYDTQFAEMSVGCEACHGKGSAHIEWANSGGGGPAILPLTEQAQQVNACAPCHSRRAQLAEGFEPGASYFDHYLPSLLEDGLYHADGQILDEVYVYGSFTQSKMHQQGVMCSDCHNPHSAQVELPGNTVCTQCHNQAGRADFPTLPKANFDSTDHHHHPMDSNGASCVSCHMVDRTYMVVDDRRDHSFRIPRPDLSVALGVPNACNDCHQDQTPMWAQDTVAGWYGTAPAPHFATVFKAGRQGRPEAEMGLVTIADDGGQPAIVRGTALSLLANYQLFGSTSAIERGLRSSEPLIQIGALQGAQRFPPEQRWRVTQKLLDAPHLAVRVEAVRGLLSVSDALPEGAREVFAPHLMNYLETTSLAADSASGQSGMAAAYLALGDVPAAEAALKTSLEINAQWVPAHVNLADLYRSSGRDRLAGEHLEQAVKLAPENPDVLLALGLWYVRQGFSDQGLPMFERAWRAQSDNPRFAYVYIVALNSLGQPQAALQVADDMLSLRQDRQILETAFSIARDAGLPEKMRQYAQGLR